MIARRHPDPEHQYMLRVAQNGDLCILLVSENEQAHLLDHQRELQNTCGGRITTPVHLTVQRFEDQDGSNLQVLSELLRSCLDDFPTFPINAVSFRSIYSPYRRVLILKWVAELSKPLYQISKLVERTLTTAGYRSLYQAGWISTWITALEGVSSARLPVYLDEIEIPHPLFVGSQVIISLINGKDDYLILDRITLKR